MSITLTPAVLNKYRNRVFVETGSFNGGGIMLATLCGFQEIHSIELEPLYYNACRQRFAADTRVRLYLGDSSQLIAGVIRNINEPITFWLDGHQFDATNKNIKTSPLLDELAAIATHHLRDHTILIDDKRVFESHYGTSEAQVYAALFCINPTYKIALEDSSIAKADIIAAKPNWK